MRDFNVDGELVGRPYQTVLEQSLTQKYPIGMIHERHGRRWRYCKAVATFTFAHRGCPNMAIIPGDTGGSAYGLEGNMYAEVPAGQSFGYISTAVAFAVDALFGGIMVVFSTGENPDIFCLRISGNDLGNGTYCKIYFDEPAPIIITTAFGINVHPSRYANVGDSASATASAPVAVVPSIKVTTGYYFWGQTKGLCWVTPTVWSGTAGHLYVFNGSDGCIIPDTGANPSLQIAGMVTERNATDYGDGLIDLMLE